MTKKPGTALIYFITLFAFAVAVYAGTQQGRLDPTDLLFAEPVKNTHEAAYAIDVKPISSQSKTFGTYRDNSLWLSSANFADSIEQFNRDDFTYEQNFPPIAANHNLIEAHIAAPVAKGKQQTRNTLHQIIEQVRSIKFEQKKESAEPVLKEKPASIEVPGKAGVNESGSSDTEPPQIKQEQTTPEDVISESTLKQIQQLTKQPERAENPLLLAEILALSEHHEQAAVLYSEALKRSADGRPLSIHDKAWLLLQTASCQKNCRPEQALKTYKELMMQCPTSTWAGVAKAQSDLLDWLQTEKPQELIELCKTELSNRRTQ